MGTFHYIVKEGKAVSGQRPLTTTFEGRRSEGEIRAQSLKQSNLKLNSFWRRNCFVTCLLPRGQNPHQEPLPPKLETRSHGTSLLRTPAYGSLEIIFLLRTGHCRLISHMCRFGLSHANECPVELASKTQNYILQNSRAQKNTSVAIFALI